MRGLVATAVDGGGDGGRRSWGRNPGGRRDRAGPPQASALSSVPEIAHPRAQIPCSHKNIVHFDKLGILDSGVRMAGTSQDGFPIAGKE